MNRRTQLTRSTGSVVVAKVASDRRKPGGLTVVRPGREAAFLAPFPIRLLPGIGPRAEERLAAAGIETIGQLAALDEEQLRVHFRGVVGRQLHDRARGIDPRKLDWAGEFGATHVAASAEAAADLVADDRCCERTVWQLGDDRVGQTAPRHGDERARDPFGAQLGRFARGAMPAVPVREGRPISTRRAEETPRDRRFGALSP